MTIQTIPAGALQTNCYLLMHETTGRCAAIDPGGEGERIAAAIERAGLELGRIFLTHGHFDHLLGVDFVCRRYGAPFALSSKDEFLLKASSTSAELFGVRAGDMPERIDIDLDGRDAVSFGRTELRIISTPGHTPGHVVLYEPLSKSLFTGDTLFRESIGRTDLPGGDYSWIMRSILDKIMPLGDDVKVYPGHGEETDLGHEALYNPFVTEVMNNEVRYE